jgi:hypothetical protein
MRDRADPGEVTTGCRCPTNFGDDGMIPAPNIQQSSAWDGEVVARTDLL